VPTNQAIGVVLGILVLALVAIGLGIQYRSLLWPILLFAAAGVFNVVFFRCRRCPECHSTLMARREIAGESQRSRVLLDCHRCEIAWDMTDHCQTHNTGGDVEEGPED
jgi:hypothetical protein